jgi:hypothetical protein
VLVVSLAYRRVSTTVDELSTHVDVARIASSMLANADDVLNTTASVTRTVHQLGLKGLDASMFSKPFLVRLLNSTTHTLEGVNRLVQRPTITVG